MWVFIDRRHDNIHGVVISLVSKRFYTLCLADKCNFTDNTTNWPMSSFLPTEKLSKSENSLAAEDDHNRHCNQISSCDLVCI